MCMGQNDGPDALRIYAVCPQFLINDQASHGPDSAGGTALAEIHLHTQPVNNLYHTVYCPGHGAVSETLWPETPSFGRDAS